MEYEPVNPALLDQSVVHTLGGMPLLARHAPVGGQPRIPLETNTRPIPERPEERALGAGEQSSITAYLRTVSLDTFSPSGDLAPRDAPRIENPDTLLY